MSHLFIERRLPPCHRCFTAVNRSHWCEFITDISVCRSVWMNNKDLQLCKRSHSGSVTEAELATWQILTLKPLILQSDLCRLQDSAVIGYAHLHLLCLLPFSPVIAVAASPLCIMCMQHIFNVSVVPYVSLCSLWLLHFYLLRRTVSGARLYSFVRKVICS